MKQLLRYLHKLNCILSSERIWQVVSFVVLVSYLAPLIIYGENINMLVYDNLDSNVVWYKILAESGMIFAPNDAIIPNMMNGLPRLSYGSEWNILLWLYYFFSPIVAYTINEVLIHVAAFFSMFLLLDRHIIASNLRYRKTVIYFASLTFALQPFWPSAGLSIAALPLVTYAFINIYKHTETKYDWLILVVIPFYSSFVLVYVFYLGFTGVFIVFDTFRYKRIHKTLTVAFFLMLSLYLFVNYRLVISTFFNNGFVSHRSEFDIFFNNSFLEATRKFYLFFMDGHLDHLRGTQMPLILPFIIFAQLIQFFTRRLTSRESLFLVILFAVSAIMNLWPVMLGSIYSIPAIFMLSIVYMVYHKKIDIFNLTMVGVLTVSAWYGYSFYHGLDILIDWFPMLKSFNISRASFVQPLLWGVLTACAAVIVHRKLHFQMLFVFLVFLVQIYISFLYSWYHVDKYTNLASFQNYYAPTLFEKLKKDIPEDITKIRFVSYGIEPAVALYNGLYTIDGYSTNYPLSYKYRFQAVNEYSTENSLDNDNVFTSWRSQLFTSDKIFDAWGSKLYILTIQSALKDYRKGLVIYAMNFNTDILVKLGADYFLSAYRLIEPKKKHLHFLKKYSGNQDSWDIYLYHIEKAGDD